MSNQKDRRVVTRVPVPEDEELTQAEEALHAVMDKRRKAGRGRPTKYSPLYAIAAEKLCLLGATDLELAQQLGISEKTFYNWQRHQPEFLQATRRAKEQADANVVGALYRRALGSEVTEVHTVNHRGRYGTTIITKRLPPDTAAASFWLRNRQRKRWRERREIAFSQSSIRAMSDTDIEVLVNKIKKFVVRRGKPMSEAIPKRLPKATKQRQSSGERDRAIHKGQVTK